MTRITKSETLLSIAALHIIFAILIFTGIIFNNVINPYYLKPIVQSIVPDKVAIQEEIAEIMSVKIFHISCIIVLLALIALLIIASIFLIKNSPLGRTFSNIFSGIFLGYTLIAFFYYHLVIYRINCEFYDVTWDFHISARELIRFFLPIIYPVIMLILMNSTKFLKKHYYVALQEMSK